jgi:hypothetical protein
VAVILVQDEVMENPGWEQAAAGCREQWLRVQAAVSEGLCPVHAVPLVPARSEHVITGHCGPCGVYGFSDPGDEAGWRLDEETLAARMARGPW